jgi:5-oxoprolinase (ATP-hydrolysing) subunit A
VPRAIDLNADVGEGLGRDVDLLRVVTSANVACGFHAGDDETMRALCLEAVAAGVAIGAHVGYRDRDGFGRRELGDDPVTIGIDVVEQIAILEVHAAACAGRVSYVKPHGALYHRATEDAACAAAIVAAAGAEGRSLAVLALPGSRLLAEARREGLVAVVEGFADRRYEADGRLVPRGRPGAVLGKRDAVRQALSIASDEGAGVRSLCVHGDTPGAPAIARLVRAELEAAGIEVRAFA